MGDISDQPSIEDSELQRDRITTWIYEACNNTRMKVHVASHKILPTYTLDNSKY